MIDQSFSNGTGVSGGTSDAYQTFTVGLAGDLTAISLHAQELTGNTLELRALVDGKPTGALLATAEFAPLPQHAGSWVTADLSVAVPVEVGDQLGFVLMGDKNIYAGFNDVVTTYAGGVGYTLYFRPLPFGGGDWHFRTWVVPVSDVDGDDLPDDADPCPDDPENDADWDGVCESGDVCPEVYDPDQVDLDGDGDGDACDTDDDGDLVADEADVCPRTPDPDQADTDGDLAGDACDDDDDGDGVDDARDACAATEGGAPTDETGCSGAQIVERTCGALVGARSRGSYVACVARAATGAAGSGLLTDDERTALVRDAAQ